MQNREIHHYRVAVPPPFIIGIPFLVGMGIQWIFPFRCPPLWLGVPLGVLCLVPSLVLLATARALFWRSRNSMRYTRRSRALMVDGPFRFTRNPLFLGLLLLYVGVCLVAGTPWPLLFLPGVVTLLHRIVVLPEERFLEDRFGDEYRDYKGRVRRWL